MSKITVDKTREIIDDFAKEIEKRKTPCPVPSKWAINFRNEKTLGIQRDVYYVPLDLLRYRKDNGRIASDVISYEKQNLKELDEKEQETQDILFNFLAEKDKEQTEILKKSIQKEGQADPAIITSDGFLINGNRRKMVLEQLRKEDPRKYDSMKVVILPGRDDPGGPPTIREIELIENRYQLQKDGKSEYTGLDRALSISRKIACGISLEEQLIDDPSFAGLSTKSKDFIRMKKEYEKNYLDPLKKANDYLEHINREGCYDLIKDRWQAFIDYSNFYNGKLKNKKWQQSADIRDDEIGKIEDVAFKIIRKNTFKGKPRKTHEIIRDLPKLLSVPESKEVLFELVDGTEDISDLDLSNNDSYKEAEIVWGQKNEQIFAKSINLAYDHREVQLENAGPISLIHSAYEKLTHKNMDITKIPKNELLDFVESAGKIIEKAQDLKSAAWERYKNISLK